MQWVFTKPVRCPSGRNHLLIGLFIWAIGSAVQAQTTSPQVVLDSLTVLDAYGQPRSIWPAGTLQLPARENYLTFRFRAAQAVPLRYQLAGLDNDWRTGLSTDRLHYANLPGGAYTLRWQAGGAAGSLPVQIEAPFWRRWWFVPVLLTYLLSVVGIVLYLFLRYRFRQKLRELQARDRIARDLHDDMGSYLSSISILSASARRNALQHPDRTQASLDKIGQTARQMLDTMGDIVWSINPAHDAMHHTIDRMRDVGNALFAPTDVAFTMEIDSDAGTFPLATEARRDFFLIYKEALTNAARYAHASQVRVRLTRDQSRLHLTIQDDGRGFDPDQPERQNLSGGNGLRNLRVRAGQLDGDLTIRSAPGTGTLVELLVPLP